jgi:hypothetical protein
LFWPFFGELDRIITNSLFSFAEDIQPLGSQTL